MASWSGRKERASRVTWRPVGGVCERINQLPPLPGSIAPIVGLGQRSRPGPLRRLWLSVGTLAHSGPSAGRCQSLRERARRPRGIPMPSQAPRGGYGRCGDPSWRGRSSTPCAGLTAEPPPNPSARDRRGPGAAGPDSYTSVRQLGKATGLPAPTLDTLAGPAGNALSCSGTDGGTGPRCRQGGRRRAPDVARGLLASGRRERATLVSDPLILREEPPCAPFDLA
jgi:hypothetical protein